MIRLYAVVVLLHAFAAWRLMPDLSGFGAAAVVALSAWLVASAALLPQGLVARRREQRAFSRALAWSGLILMGSFSSLFVLTVLRDAGLLVAGLLDLAVPGVLPMQALPALSAAGVPLLALLLTAVGFANARRRAGVRTVEVAIAGLPAALHGFSIAQITDIHIGPTIKRPYVDAIVDAVNALGADMIAVTGDLVDGSVHQLSGHAAPLARLAARHGTYFVTGNHEYYSGAEAWIAELRRLGLRVLMNEHVVLEHAGESVVVAGVTDYSAHHFHETHRSDPGAAMAGAPAHAAVRLLLAHQPRSAFAAEPEGFHLQLSGHTHGGQFWPWNFLVRLQQPFTAGLRRLGSLWVYTSRGTGYWGPPKRLWAPSEITHLRLVTA
jgi:predicted MPP superfamily phosphohydrolase